VRKGGFSEPFQFPHGIPVGKEVVEILLYEVRPLR
jgi:hypothetical protein